MERGKLGFEDAHRAATVFVFEGLIAKPTRPRSEALYLQFRRWPAALATWQFDLQVVDYIAAAVSRYEINAEVLTWHPPEFAELLHDRLWEMNCPVRETKSSTYRSASQRYATDSSISIVYDPQPSHRYGYGFKCREFNLAMF